MQRHCNFGKKIVDCLPDRDNRTLKSHTELGARIMDVGVSPILAMAKRIALTHHERWDGTGYPLKLAGVHIRSKVGLWPSRMCLTPSAASVHTSRHSRWRSASPFSRKVAASTLTQPCSMRFSPAGRHHRSPDRPGQFRVKPTPRNRNHNSSFFPRHPLNR